MSQQPPGLREALELIANTDSIDAALDPQRLREIASRALAAHPVEADEGTPGLWFVRKRTNDQGELLDCFVAAPDCQGFAYDAQILGDDEYRDGIARKQADCELIANAVNQYRAMRTASEALKVAELDE